ncbi:MAG TPA: 2-isopropylmalate synthase [Beijerinckiaceae bacterium]|jgi:2-isopropylmalate synthase|nr:2-isopropylmalate synthase [Beijerinckiaceae bacterium]
MTATHKTSVHKGRAPKTAVTKTPASKTHASKPSDAEGKAASAKDRVIIFDTTLRDGEQSPGATMTFEEKLEVADLLDEMGVDVIEAGFPIASQGDFEAVHAVAKRAKHAVIAGLSRANAKDIDRCAEAVRPARRGRIHTVIATSPLHMKAKLQMEPEAVLQAVIDSVTRARNHIDDVEWSCEDGTRSEVDFLCRCVEAAIKAGATTVNIPDTVGYTTPDEYRVLFETVIERVPNSDKAIFSVHCHNDLGLAVANSLAGCVGGARQIECAVNGLGERAGNTSLEEVVMAMRVRPDVLPFQTRIDTTKLMRASKLVSAVSSFPVQYNKAIVGRNAFAHESGIHQDGMLKNPLTYEIMTPESVGVSKTSLVMGKHSGRNAFRTKLAELGYKLADNQLEDAFLRFKDLADRKKIVYDEDIEALVDENIATAQDNIKLVSLSVIAGTRGPQRATMRLSIDGRAVTEEVEGNGPVDATFNAIKAIVPHEAVLELYQVHAVTEGTDAQAEVSVRLAEGGKTVTARAADPDTLVASAKAYLGALNRLMVKRKRGKPEAMSAAE